ncbi:MAG: DUF1345 domain-containing protein [Actinomycetota bacterium]|nr:DUF1345 domain-containing protein [Actinomycetota bacterium]
MHRRVRLHLLISALLGLAVAAVALLIAHWTYAPSLAWDAAAISYLALTWREVWRLSPEQTREIAAGEDPSRALDDFIVIAAALVSLLTVVLVLSHIGSTPQDASLMRTVLGIASVVLAWSVVHTVYTIRYAKLYYAEPVGGINFNNEDLPAYTDFAYLSFGVGMAFQVADTNVETAGFRKMILGHALLSFLFATTILAVTINLVAGLNN